MQVKEIPIEDISISELNVRKASKEDQELNTLANSIQENGLLQPIIVKQQKDNKFKLIAGQRRYNACNVLNWHSIPAVIIENADELKVLTLSTVENLQRVDLNPVEKMEAFNKIYRMYNGNKEKVAKATGYTTQTVNRYLKINEGLNPSIKEEVKNEERNVSVEVLEELVKKIDTKDQKRYLDHHGNMPNKEIVKRIKRINKKSSFQETQSNQNRKELIKEFILKVLPYRIFFLFKNKELFRELSLLFERFFQVFRKLKKEKEIPLKVFGLLLFNSDRYNIEDFLYDFYPIMSRDKSEIEKFFEYSIRRSSIDIEQLFELILEDIGKNSSEYSEKIKVIITDYLQKFIKNDIHREYSEQLMQMLK